MYFPNSIPDNLNLHDSQFSMASSASLNASFSFVVSKISETVFMALMDKHAFKLFKNIKVSFDRETYGFDADEISRGLFSFYETKKFIALSEDVKNIMNKDDYTTLLTHYQFKALEVK